MLELSKWNHLLYVNCIATDSSKMSLKEDYLNINVGNVLCCIVRRLYVQYTHLLLANWMAHDFSKLHLKTGRISIWIWDEFCCVVSRSVITFTYSFVMTLRRTSRVDSSSGTVVSVLSVLYCASYLGENVRTPSLHVLAYSLNVMQSKTNFT